MLSRSEIMSRVRSRNTTPERTVRRSLRRLGVKTSRRLLPGSPDFVIANARIALFVHGCFWHRHGCAKGRALPTANRAYWAKKFELNQERDRRVARALRSDGWRVLTVWECQMRDDASTDRLLRRKLQPSRRRTQTG